MGVRVGSANATPKSDHGNCMVGRRNRYPSLCFLLAMSGMTVSTIARTQVAAPPGVPGQLSEIVIEAPEPRFVAPTRRDKIGRILGTGHDQWSGPLSTGAGYGCQPIRRQ